MRYLLLLTALLGSAALLAQTQLPEIELRPGLVITQSCRVKSGVYRFAPKGDSLTALVRVAGRGISVDFQQAELRSTADSTRPDLFRGLAVEVEGADIQIKNLKIRGYKVGVLARPSTQKLLLDGVDASYNYRPRLLSGWAKEDERDWLSYHQNDQHEWLRYGAGIYLLGCTEATVRNCRVSACQNALLLDQSDNCLIYNNFFTFNSGLGVGLYRSNRNRIMHNRLDWNVRGYSHNHYARGQDSAALLCYEQSNNNTFAYNSCTHSGDGFFLWAGQSTMDTGQGGCNDNLVFGNDFSYAPTNGVEVTFSRNRIAGNLIKGCTYGIWGGYSFDSEISGNWIAECQAGVAIEHGQRDTIRQNLFTDNTVGVMLWERPTQPADWPYARLRDTRSHDALIDRNVFLNTRKPLKIGSSKNVNVNGENLFFDFETLLDAPHSNDSLRFLRNDIYGTSAEIDSVWQTPVLAASRSLNFSHPSQEPPANPYAPLEIAVNALREPDSLAGGMLAVLPPGFPQGRQFIVVGEWGPFDFKRPIVTLDRISANGKQAEFTLLGPSGDWKITQSKGVQGLSARQGQVPAELTAIIEKGTPEIRLQLEYNGPETVTDEFGRRTPPGQVYRFEFVWRKEN